MERRSCRLLARRFWEALVLDMIDLLGHPGFDLRSSIVLTYSLDLPLYDGLIRRALNRAGIWNQITFCDFGCYVLDAPSHAAALYAGRHYSVTPVWQNGAFHPKVYLLLGPRHGRLLIGSGNATVGGLIRNAEVFGLFDYDGEKDAGPHSAFQSVFAFVESLAGSASDPVQKQIKSARQMAPWLALPPVEDGRRVLIGGPGRLPLSDQVAALLPSKKSDDLIICASSFDRALEGLRRLASMCIAKPVCIVQPEHAEMDGQSVRRVGKAIDWRPFVDPYPKEKRQRKDVRAHAKVFIFGYGKTETCIFGSANASAPALGSTNTEIVVALPQRARGSTEKHLGLSASIRAKSIEAELSQKEWQDDDNDSPDDRFNCLLAAVSIAESGYRLTLVSGTPPKNALLALAQSSLSRPLATTTLRRDGNAHVGQKVSGDDGIKCAWIVDESGKTLSNSVSVTWPMVASPRKGGGGGAKIGQYLGAMQDGAVLGTILFELLDQFRDFEVMQAGSGKRGTAAKSAAQADGKAQEQSAEFFYTDAKADAAKGHQWMGDRIDLDILASLVQPLKPAGNAEGVEDEVYDDTKLDEEAEFREIDEKKGVATGTEKPRRDPTPSDKLEAAIRRLERRLDRAATSIENALQFLENLQSLSPNGVARQIWMTHIGAFLAGRKTVSADGDEFTCLHPWYFADYVLRICRALVGSKKVGGFLDRLSKSTWEGYDGEALSRGLAFLWTCAEWAAAYMVHYYSNGEGKDELPQSIAVASAELVAARFIWKVSSHCEASDQESLTRRFPAWETVPAKQRELTHRRLAQVVQVIQCVEGLGAKSFLGPDTQTDALKAGALVHNPITGVTMLAKDAAPRAYHLVNLSQTGDEPKKFGAVVAPVLVDGKPYRLFQRTDESSAA